MMRGESKRPQPWRVIFRHWRDWALPALVMLLADALLAEGAQDHHWSPTWIGIAIPLLAGFVVYLIKPWNWEE